jgi:hypothetical protein
MGCSNEKIDKPQELQKNKIQNQLTAHHASTYLVTCMDCKLLDEIVRAMDKMGYNNNYDQIIVAGASLGFCQSKNPHWRETFIDHLEIGIGLHQFRQFIFIDHFDCKAYLEFFPEIITIEDQKKCHKEQLQNAHDFLAKKFPDLKFNAYIMTLDGELEKIDIEEGTKKVLNSENKNGDEILDEINKNDEKISVKKIIKKKSSSKVSLL